MGKAVRIGDLYLSETADGYTVSHAYDGSASGKRFRISEANLTEEEVRGLGMDPKTGDLTETRLRLRLMHGEDYWCLLIEDLVKHGPVRNLGTVPDAVVSKIYYHKTSGAGPFADLSYEDIRRVRKAREESQFRARMLDHIEDTKAIRGLLGEILEELRKANEKPKRATPKRKPKADPA